MVQAGVFRNVASSGIHPCSSSGVNAMPIQNMKRVCAPYSTGSTCQLKNKLSR